MKSMSEETLQVTLLCLFSWGKSFYQWNQLVTKRTAKSCLGMYSEQKATLQSHTNDDDPPSSSSSSSWWSISLFSSIVIMSTR